MRDRAWSKTIGVLSLDPTSYDKAWTLLGIERATRDSDYLVSIVSVPGPTRRTLTTAVGRLRSLAVDGILVVAPQQDTIDTLADLSGDIPLVAVASGPQQILSAVAIDHYAGAAAATGHLLELGHHTVFHIAGPADRTSPGPRFAGWRDTLVAAGADVSLPMIGDWSADVGYELGCRLATRGRSPRSSWPTTRWPSECCAPCSKPGGECPMTSAWSALTARRRESFSVRR